MAQQRLTLSLTETDLSLLHKARGNLSLSSFLLRCAFNAIAREIHLTHYAPDRHTRNKACVLRFLQNGCCSVEDIESVAFSLSQTEIEMYLFELEQEGVIRRAKAKRGRMWRWELI